MFPHELPLVRELEQGEYGGLRLETVRKLPAVLGVATSALMSEPDAPEPDVGDAGHWAPMWRAIDGEQPGGIPTMEGVRSALTEVMALLVDGRFAEMGAVLPPLLRDADALVSAAPARARMAAKSLRAQVRQVAGSLMLHAWQFDTAERAFQELRQARPQWLAQQRYARDILATVITRRRTLTGEMRDLAAFLRLPL